MGRFVTLFCLLTLLTSVPAYASGGGGDGLSHKEKFFKTMESKTNSSFRKVRKKLIKAENELERMEKAKLLAEAKLKKTREKLAKIEEKLEAAKESKRLAEHELHNHLEEDDLKRVAKETDTGQLVAGVGGVILVFVLLFAMRGMKKKDHA